MKAWMKIACLGLLIGAYAAGCTITTDDDEDGIGGANPGGGTAGTGGEDTDTGGAKTGGSAGAENTGGSAGAENTGGSAGAGGPNSCEVCLYDKCADEMDDCAASDDSDDNGTKDCFQEFFAYQECIQAKANEDPPQEYFDEGVREDCSAEAALFDEIAAIPLTPTNALIACAAPTEVPDTGDCFVECLDFVGAGGAGD